MATDSPYKAEDYTVGWICALPVELAASAEMLDKEHPQLQDTKDSNSYTLGSIGEHNVVIGCLPFGQMGVVSAASVAMQMKSRFRSIRLGLMVGIGGGVPSADVDIRLGDVVVSRPYGQHGGVVQYDLGKTGPGGQHIRTGSLNSPPQVLLTALATVEAARMRERFALSEHLSPLGRRLPKFAYPQALQDNLYKPTYVHTGGATCSKCSEDQLEERDERDSTAVAIHYGTIASGNQVIKDGVERDRLSRELGGILCFEMEAAGLMNNFPCLVIRGICDYADSHKNKGWQPYAAATAAAFAKGLLYVIPAHQVAIEPTIDEAMKGLAARVAENIEVSQRVEERVLTAEEEKILDWLSSSNFSKPQNSARETRASGTGQWLLDLEAYTNWRDSSPGLLWLYGAAGCGKTILCSTVIEDLQNDRRKRSAYWYFQFSDDATQRICNMMRSFIRQLSTSPLPAAINQLWQDHKTPGSDPGIEELAKALDEVINNLGGEVFIIMDALDECPQTPDQPARKELLARIRNLLTKHSENLHILVTSRPEHDLYPELKSHPAINVEKFVEGDVRQFLKSALRTGDLKLWSDDIKQEIEDGLLSTEERRFRWVDLQIRSLELCNDETDIHKALRTIPKSLEHTYREVLQRIPEINAKRARLILMWLATSLRPLKLDEIAAAVSIPHPEFVLRICPSMLVTFNHEHTDKVIKLAHFSVKEYLVLEKHKESKESEDEGEFGYQFSNELAHATIGEATISYLLTTNNDSVFQQEIISWPLLQYSAEYWYQHAAAVKDHMANFPRLREQIDRIFSPEYSQSYLNWLRTYDCDDNEYSGHGGSMPKAPDQYPRPLYYASLLGFDHSVETLIRRGAEISVQGGTFENAYIAAAVHGNSKIVARLLDGHFTVQKRDVSKILREIKRNVKETIKVLLDAGLVKSVAGESESGRIQESDWVVKTAVENLENGLEVIAVLLDQLGAHALITEDVMRTAAGSLGNGREVMALLLDQVGPDVLITEGVVHAAVRNGMSGGEVIRLLLDRRGADVKITDQVVQAAAGNGMNGVEVMTVLLNRRGSDVQITKEVVKEAAKNAKSGKKVMELLLDRRWPDVRITGEVVEAIVEDFDDDVVRPLLDHRGEITEGVVKAAARNSGNGKEVMRLLLKRRGSDVQITREVVKEAAKNAKSGKKVMELLLDRRWPDIRITGEVVEAVVEDFDDDVVRLLLDHRGEDVQITEGVVKAAARNSRNGEEVMRLLLKRRGADVQITEKVEVAIATFFGEVMVRLFPDRRGAAVHINEEEAEVASARLPGAPTPSIKGKLTVKVTEARGLRESRDPYTVATFQHNELVSRGPLPEDQDDNEDLTRSPVVDIHTIRSGSDSYRQTAIPDFKLKGRQSFTSPKWDTEVVFDVVDSDSRLNIAVYDRAGAAEEFLGQVDLEAHLTENDNSPVRGWFPLRGRNDSDTGLAGEIYVEMTFQRTEKKHYGPEDFQTLKLIGKGTFGQVYQVRKKDTNRIYAMKALPKKVIVREKETAHAVGERNILVRTSIADSPFIVGLKFSFQTATDLYLVTDYMSGGELFWHLQKEGRFDEKRAKFYIAEVILALQHLHMHDIVYLSLKPENILLDANGHIALCDFGLSKTNLTKTATTNTFCGTTEYTAPEVLLDEAGYTKMVDFWSLGVLAFEMCCGWSPFYAEDTHQMYRNIVFGKVRFPRDALTTEGRALVKGLLNRNPKCRLGATGDPEELRRHPFFTDIDWEALEKKLVTPPFKPKLKSVMDVSKFDPEFTNALSISALAAGVPTSTPLSPNTQANFKGFTFVSEDKMQGPRMDDEIFVYEEERMQGRSVMDEDDWEDSFDTKCRGDRMSGIVETGTHEDSSMFNSGNFDM